MTIKEFFEWAVENEVIDYDMTITHSDGGGFYTGFRYAEESDIEIHRNSETVEL